MTKKNKDERRSENKRRLESKRNKKQNPDEELRHGKTAQGDIPFREWYENGIFCTGEDEYCIVCTFSNAGYLSKTEPEKLKKNAVYTSLLTELPSYIHYQEIVYNTPADSAAYIRAIADGTGESEYERSFFNVQRSFAQGVDADHSIQRYLLTLSTKVREDELPYNKLNEAFVLATKRFGEMGSTLRQLSVEEVFAELYRMYCPYRENMMPIPHDIYRRGLSIRDIIAPDSVKYGFENVLLGTSTYVKILSVSSYGSEIRDNLIYMLVNNDLPMYLIKHIDHVEKTDAVKQVKSQLDELIARKGQREEKKKYIPGELLRSIESCEQLLDALSGNEELMRQTVYVAVYAESEDRLSSYVDRLRSVAISQGCTLRNVTVLTREGFKSCLPLGRDMLHRSQIMLSGEASVATPFAYEAYFDKNGFFYGYNYYNGEPVIRNRKYDKSSHGFVFGQTGSGKGMWVKHELSNVFFQNFYKSDEIIVIDATGEYISFANAVGGKVIELEASGNTHLNPLHVSQEKLKKNGKDKACIDKISSFVALLSELKGEPLTAVEKSVVDDIGLKTMKKGKATLDTFYKALCKCETEDVREMISWLKRYVSGSVSLFSGVDTDEDIKARLTVYTTRNLPEDLKNAAMLSVLDRIERRTEANAAKGRRTWLYIEEMHRYFSGNNTFSAEAFNRFYAESRHNGVIITGVTQLPHTVVANRYGADMLSNSRFVVMSELDEKNIDAVTELYDLNEEQKQILRSPAPGQYIVRTQNAPMAVKLLYPSGNMMYDLFSTSFGDENDDERQ